MSQSPNKTIGLVPNEDVWYFAYGSNLLRNQKEAGCDLDPFEIRSGKENLFEEDKYRLIFPNSDPKYYLPRYWLMKAVSDCSRGYPERGYAKWLVLGFVWNVLEAEVKNKAGATAFRGGCEAKKYDLLAPLHKVIDRAFIAALKYYRANCGSGQATVDVSTFFRKRGHDKEFARFWESPQNKGRRLFAQSWKQVSKAIADIVSE